MPEPRRFRLVEDPTGPVTEGLLKYAAAILDEYAEGGEGIELRQAIPLDSDSSVLVGYNS